MARAISDEELQLKRRARRRLIGAIVLVTALVIVLPMVLDTEPRPVSQNISVRIPSTDTDAFTPKVAPAPAADEAKPEAPAAKPKPAKAEKPKSAAKPAKSTPPPGGGRYVIQVIALADAEKAQHLQGQIAAAGIKSYTEVVRTVKGDVTRVRAGPFPTREAAEKAREQLKSLGMNGNITTR